MDVSKGGGLTVLSKFKERKTGSSSWPPPPPISQNTHQDQRPAGLGIPLLGTQGPAAQQQVRPESWRRLSSIRRWVGRGREQHTTVGRGGKGSRQSVGSGGAQRSRARTAQKLPGARRQAPSPRRYPQTNSCPEASFPNSTNSGADPCPPAGVSPLPQTSLQKLRPHLSSIRLPEADVPPNLVPLLRSLVATALLDRLGNTWLRAGGDCGLCSLSRTGAYLLRPGAPSSRQRSALDAAAPSAAWPRLLGVATPSCVLDWRVARNMILCVPGGPAPPSPCPTAFLCVFPQLRKFPDSGLHLMPAGRGWGGWRGVTGGLGNRKRLGGQI